MKEGGGAVAGGALIFTHTGGYGFESRCARAIFWVGFWCFGAHVAARAKRRVVRGRTGGSCEYGGWPRVRHFPRFFSMLCFAVYIARRLLRSKTWISATLHRRGGGKVSEARNACFGITGARDRPIPTLLPYETCAQTPLGRHKLLFHRDPDFADAPETAQNDDFRRHFAPACFFAKPFTQACGPRPKAPLAPKLWLRSLAGREISILPQPRALFRP